MNSFQISRSVAGQQGVVLITALVFLVVLSMLGITMMSTNTLEERMAANMQDYNRAFQSAESAIVLAENQVVYGGRRAIDTADNMNVSSYGNLTYSVQKVAERDSGSGCPVSTCTGGQVMAIYSIRGAGKTNSNASVTINVGKRVMEGIGGN